jgi:hypothetical protein
MEELARYLRALVVLQVQLLEVAAARGETVAVRSEVILADAGFTAREIGVMVGKTPAAVAKAISRARATRRTADVETEASATSEADL